MFHIFVTLIFAVDGFSFRIRLFFKT